MAREESRGFSILQEERETCVVYVEVEDDRNSFAAVLFCLLGATVPGQRPGHHFAVADVVAVCWKVPPTASCLNRTPRSMTEAGEAERGVALSLISHTA